jgi:lysophospholipase L1-like esterase
LGHEAYKVIEEGLNARTSVFDDPLSPCFGTYDCNGRKYLMPCLHTAKPIDVVVVGLGTNDMKSYFSASPETIAAGLAVLVNDIQSSIGTGPDDLEPPHVLLLTPPPIIETATSKSWGFEGTASKADAFPALWEAISNTPVWSEKVEVLHLRDVAAVSEVDGIHFPGGETQHQIAEAVEAKLRDMMGW